MLLPRMSWTSERAIVRKRGLTPEQFKKAFEDHEYDEACLTLQDLKNPEVTSGTGCYKGVLVKDDKRLEHIGIWYEFDVGVKTFEKTMNLYHLNQRHENQGTALFEEMCRPSGLEEPEVKKLRLATATVDSIWENIRRTEARSKDLARRKQLEEGEHKDGDQPDIEMAEKDEEKEPLPPGVDEDERDIILPGITAANGKFLPTVKFILAATLTEFDEAFGWRNPLVRNETFQDV